jgi:hypothetical protein
MRKGELFYIYLAPNVGPFEAAASMKGRTVIVNFWCPTWGRI